MELVTGFKGEPHISAENWADLNRGIVGEGSYVLPGGEKFRAELVTNNLLKIYDGCGIMQGRQIVIPAGQSDEITIDNGTQGEKRIDLVGVRYAKDDSSKIESTAPFYLKGTPAESDPVAPAYTEGDIRAGDLTADWPLYELELDGLNVVSVTPLFETLLTGADVKAELEELNDKLDEKIIVQRYSNRINVSNGQNSYTAINVNIPDGYTIIGISTYAIHATTLCGGGAYDSDNNRIVIPFSAHDSVTPETFHVDLTLMVE